MKNIDKIAVCPVARRQKHEHSSFSEVSSVGISSRIVHRVFTHSPRGIGDLDARASVRIERLASVLILFLCASWLPAYAVGSSGQAIAAPAPSADAEYRVLCWHDVPSRVEGDAYATSLDAFLRQIAYLDEAGCAFVSVDQVLEASRGGTALPDKAVLLTFDDAYESFYASVFPVLKARGYPCLLAVVSSWPDYPEGRSERVPKLMSWSEIKEVSDSGLVEVASHSHDGHRAITADPYGSTGPALAVRAYDVSERSYEDAGSYGDRVLKDLRSSSRIIEDRTGRRPRVLVWPYGRYTETGCEMAMKAGFSLAMTLDSGLARLSDPMAVPRRMIAGSPPLGSFAWPDAGRIEAPAPMRIIQADLDRVYDEDPRACARNIDAFVERMSRIKPSAVYLQAFADEKGEGVVTEVYFPNRVVPMKADIFGRVCRALSLEGIRVYAWMPTLSLRLPDDEENERLRVKERRDGVDGDPSSWYSNRLSPFSDEARDRLATLYDDLASSAMIDGVLFQDDAYLSDYEDFSAYALADYASVAGGASVPYASLTDDRKRAWTELKTDRILELTDRLEAAVRRWRPTAAFARCLYARPILEPESEEWYSQDLRKSLDRYDYVVVMAYPDMEGAADAESWLRTLVRRVADVPGGLERTVFKTQAYDWSARRWLGASTLESRMRALADSGAIHLGYYPDDYTVDEPALKTVRGALFPGRPGAAGGDR